MAWSDDIKFLTDYQNEFGSDPKGTGDPAGMEELYKEYKSNFDSFKSIDAQFHDWYSDAHDGLSVTGLEGGEYEKARQAFLNEKRGINSQPVPSPAAQPKPSQQSNAQTLEKSVQPVQQPNENTEEPTQLNEVEVVAKKENNKNMANNQNSEPNVIEGGGGQDPATTSSSFDLDAILSDSSIRDSYENRYKYLSDGKVSRQDAKDLGLRRLQRWRLNRAIDRGNNERIKDYVNSGAKRTYVSNGKFITEGEKGWDDKAFENAKAAGFGGYNSGRRWKETLGNAYNNAVDDWRKNTEITPDPYTGQYMAKGFNDGANVDVTNSEWFKNGRMKTESAKMQKLQQDIVNKAMYDPDSNTYFATDDLGNKVGVLSADWFTGNQKYREAAQLRTYRKNVDSMSDDDLANTYSKKWGSQSALADSLGISKADLEAFNATGKKAWSQEKRNDFMNTQAQALEKKLDEMRRNADGTFNYEGSLEADRIIKYLANQLKDGNNPYKFIDSVKFGENGRYSKAGQNAQAVGAWSEIKKQGGIINFNKARTYKSGGNIPKAQLGATIFGKDSAWGKGLDFGLSFIPGVNTANQALGYAQGNVSGKQLALAAGMDLLGPAAKLAGGLYRGYKVYKGANAAVNTLKNADKAYKTVAKTLPEYQRVAKLEKMLASAKKTKDAQKIARIEKDLSAANTQLYKQMAKNPATSKIVTDLNKASAAARTAAPVSKKTAYAIGKVTNPFKGSFLNPTKGLGWKGKGLYWGARGLAGASNATGMTNMIFGGGENNQPTADTTPNVIPGSAGSGYSYGSGYGSEYGSNSGSTQTTSTEAPFERTRFSEDVLVNRKNGGKLNMRNLNYYQEGGAVAAAPAGGGGSALEMVLSDEQMASMFCQAMSQQMGQEVTPDALIQLVQQNPQAAEQLEAIAQQFIQQVQGAQSAKHGAKLSYIKSLKSGCPEGYEVSYNKKGGRLCKECVKKAQIGAKLRKGFETAVNAISPGEALYNPENQKAASRQLFGKVGDAFNPASMVRGAGNYVKEAVNGVKNAYSTVTNPRVSTMDKAKAVGSAVLPFLPGGHLPTASRKLGQRMAAHQKGGNLSSKEQQDLNAAISRNKKKYGTKYDPDQLAGRKSVGKDKQGRDLYLNGDGEAMPIACKGGKTKKCATGGFLTLENLQNTYRNLNK